MKGREALSEFRQHVGYQKSIVAVFAVLTFCTRLDLSKKSNQNTSTQRTSSTKGNKPPDDFVSVACRLEADENKATFEAKLKKIVKARKA